MNQSNFAFDHPPDMLLHAKQCFSLEKSTRKALFASQNIALLLNIKNMTRLQEMYQLLAECSKGKFSDNFNDTVACALGIDFTNVPSQDVCKQIAPLINALKDRLAKAYEQFGDEEDVMGMLACSPDATVPELLEALNVLQKSAKDLSRKGVGRASDFSYIYYLILIITVLLSAHRVQAFDTGTQAPACRIIHGPTLMDVMTTPRRLHTMVSMGESADQIQKYASSATAFLGDDNTRGAILEEFSYTATPKKNPVLVISVGAPGRGKTNAINIALSDLEIGDDYALIGADDIMGKYPVYQELIEGLGTNQGSFISDIHAADHLFQAADEKIIPEMVSRYMDSRFNVVYDSTGKNVEKLSRMVDKFRKAGYTIAVASAYLDDTIGDQRIISRAVQTGRMVPVLRAREMAAKISVNKPSIFELADVTYDMDNTHNEFDQSPVVKIQWSSIPRPCKHCKRHD